MSGGGGGSGGVCECVCVGGEGGRRMLRTESSSSIGDGA